MGRGASPNSFTTLAKMIAFRTPRECSDRYENAAQNKAF